MDALLALHRKQLRDLQSKLTQKKKSATKKTRKGINDECAALEQQLAATQQEELAAFSNNGTPEINTQNSAAEGDTTDAAVSLINNPAIAHDGHTASEPSPSLEQQTASLRLYEPQLSSPPSSPPQQVQSLSSPHPTSQTPRKPNRQKERLARRAAEQSAAAAKAAEEAAQLPDLKERERESMAREFERRGLREVVVRADGHCLYAAIADQMGVLGVGVAGEGQGGTGEAVGTGAGKEDYKAVRRAAAAYIASNGEDFLPFLEEPLEGYVHKVRDTGEWGGQVELMALARRYGVDINVLQGDGRVEKIEGSEGEGDGKRKEKATAWLAYYRHGFGLGEHYNSLRKIGA